MAEELRRCTRCEEFGRNPMRPVKEFYKRREDGAVLPVCKECRSELVKRYRHRMVEARRLARREKPTPMPVAAEALFNGSPAPTLATWRCEGCGRRTTSTMDHVPRGWREAKIVPGRPAVLCGKCSGRVLLGMRITRSVLERRN